VFGGTLSLTQSINQSNIRERAGVFAECWADAAVRLPVWIRPWLVDR